MLARFLSSAAVNSARTRGRSHTRIYYCTAVSILLALFRRVLATYQSRPREERVQCLAADKTAFKRRCHPARLVAPWLSWIWQAHCVRPSCFPDKMGLSCKDISDSPGCLRFRPPSLLPHLALTTTWQRRSGFGVYSCQSHISSLSMQTGETKAPALAQPPYLDLAALSARLRAARGRKPQPQKQHIQNRLVDRPSRLPYDGKEMIRFFRPDNFG